MNRIYLYLLGFLLCIQCKENDNNQIHIRGIVKNSNGEYITLAIEHLHRGSLNFDGFKSVGCRTGEDGKFLIAADKITEGSNYTLFCNNQALTLVLFKGDDLELEFDVNNIDSIFIRGKGAGKNNVLLLEQFQRKYQYNFNFKMAQFKAYMDSLTLLQSKILKAIYEKDTACKEIRNVVNLKDIKRIIEETPVTPTEYGFLKQIILANKYSLAGYPSYLCEHNLADSSRINFSDFYFDFFNAQEFKEIDIVPNWYFSCCIYNILQMEYLREMQTNNPKLTYRDWNFMYQDSLYWTQKNRLLKTMTTPDVYDYFRAEELSANTLNLGDIISYSRDKKEFFNNCNDKKYIDRFKNFESLLDSGLKDKEYDLGNSKCTLNDITFKQLLERYKGQNLYLVIWTSGFAEAEVIPFLPALLDLEKECKGDIKVLNICIDEAKNKNLWAAKIIDNTWKGEHYFFPIKSENDNIVQMLNCKKIFGYCDGGATYKFIDKNGKMVNDFGSPQQLSREKIKEISRISPSI